MHDVDLRQRIGTVVRPVDSYYYIDAHARLCSTCSLPVKP